MSPSLYVSLAAGFLVGLIVAFVFGRFLWERKAFEGSARRGRSSEAWAMVMQHAVDELKTRQVAADSQRQLAEDRASQAEMLALTILESVPSGVAFFDVDGELVTANPVARRLLGSLSELPFELSVLLHRSRNGVDPPYTEVELPAGDATIPVGIQTRKMKIGIAGGGTVMVLAELQELRNLQTRARLMEELADLGQLAAGIAHEFRNAAGVLRTSAQYLKTKVDHGASDAVDDLLRETDRMTRVTEDLLDFARPWESALEAVEMDPLVQEVVEQLEEVFPEAVFIKNLQCGDNTVYGKSAALARVIDNLIRNAVEAGTEDMSIELLTLCAPAGSGRWFRLLVNDRGRGLPEGDPERLFLPFVSSKPEGTGMGLALARKIARLHGGDITIHTRKGGGVTAEISLPLMPADGTTVRSI